MEARQVQARIQAGLQLVGKDSATNEPLWIGTAAQWHMAELLELGEQMKHHEA